MFYKFHLLLHCILCALVSMVFKTSVMKSYEICHKRTALLLQASMTPKMRVLLAKLQHDINNDCKPFPHSCYVQLLST